MLMHIYEYSWYGYNNLDTRWETVTDCLVDFRKRATDAWLKDVKRLAHKG